MSDAYLSIDEDGNPYIGLCVAGVYQDNTNSEEYDVYDELMQHLIGNILKHGVEFVRCEDMPKCDCHLEIRAKKYSNHKRRFVDAKIAHKK